MNFDDILQAASPANETSAERGMAQRAVLATVRDTPTAQLGTEFCAAVEAAYDRQLAIKARFEAMLSNKEQP